MASESRIKAVTTKNPCAMTIAEISGNDRKKALELLAKLKQLEKERNETNKRIRANP